MADTAKPKTTKTTKTTKKPASAAAKAPKKATAAKPRSSAAKKPNREHMIAEAAYYKAQKRGFSGGDHIRDWLEAEAEIDKGSTGKRKAAAKK